jgi:hypothetical protein
MRTDLQIAPNIYLGGDGYVWIVTRGWLGITVNKRSTLRHNINSRISEEDAKIIAKDIIKLLKPENAKKLPSGSYISYQNSKVDIHIKYM